MGTICSHEKRSARPIDPIQWPIFPYTMSLSNFSRPFRNGLSLGAALLALSTSVPAQERDYDPSHLNLPALLQCEATVGDYNELAFWLTGESGSPEKLGWTKVESGNPFLLQYEMNKSVSVFGGETRTLAFAGSGILAVLDDNTTSAPALARKLGIDPILDTPAKFMGEKEIAKEVEENEMLTVTTRISLNVSTVDSHPGKVLAGCSYNYKIDVKD